MASIAVLRVERESGVKKAGLSKGRKVVRLRPRTAKNKRPGLTKRQKENLVLEYRLKARKLARSILRRWHARLDLQEVDSVVDLSLCEAVKRFNPNKGAAFLTFLYYHLRGNLIRAVTVAASSNSVPLPDIEMVDSGDYSDRASNGSRGAATALEVAEALCKHDYPQPDEVLYRKELAAISHEACMRLDPLAREVIHRIFSEEQQLTDIAHNLGYSRCHISRVKRKALENLHEDLKDSVHHQENLPPPQFDDEVEVRRQLRRAIQRRKPRAGRNLGHINKVAVNG